MRIDAVVFDCGDAVRLARFWAEALGWSREDDPEDELSIMVEPPEDEAFLPMLLFAEVPEAKHGKNRVHLDVVAEDGVDDEVIRLEAMGATDITTFKENNAPGLVIHETGTARMGRDPKTSVLNAHNQIWDAPNVFVTDGSCMASSACVNPSLTYMALTARAADFAVNELKRQNL